MESRKSYQAVWMAMRAICVCLTYSLTLIVLLLTPRLAKAGPVSGTIYDTDYLKAQLGGYQGVAYPRFTNPNGTDGGQLLYYATLFSGYGYVLDLSTGVVAATTGGYGGVQTYAFNALPPGTHTLIFIEGNRSEVYKPSSKSISVTVPANNAAVTNANINLVRQWRFGSLIATAPPDGTYFHGQATEFLDKNNGWTVVAQKAPTAGYPPGGGGGHSSLNIYRTTDGAKTWAKISRIDAPSRIYGGYIQDYGIMDLPFRNGIHFTDSNRGVLFTDAYNRPGPGGPSIYTTADGGVTWTLGSTFLGWATNRGEQGDGPLSETTGYMQIAWDQSNRKSGVIWMPYNYYLDPPQIAPRRVKNVNTIRTTDGGVTWSEMASVTSYTDSTYVGEGVAVFDDGNSFGMTTTAVTESGLLIDAVGLRNGGSIYTLTTNPDGPMDEAYTSYIGVYGGIRTAGSSALIPIYYGGVGNSPLVLRLYRTDDDGVSWNRVNSWMGSNVGDGRWNFGPVTDLLPDNSFWSWDNYFRNSNIYRSVDGGLSTTDTGKFIAEVLSEHNGIDVHTGRFVFDTDQFYSTLDMAGSFYFDEEAASGPARLLPYLGIESNSLALSLFNAGGDWATDITLTGLAFSNGVTYTSTLGLPWNIGAIPPASAETGISFALSNLPAKGTRFSATLTGTYNGGQEFRATLYFIAP